MQSQQKFRHEITGEVIAGTSILDFSKTWQNGLNEQKSWALHLKSLLFHLGVTDQPKPAKTKKEAASCFQSN